MRVRWTPTLDRAAQIVLSYDTGVTLRQLFYRLVSEELIPNTASTYTTLSHNSAAARREGWFPDLIDPTRRIHQYQSWDGPEQALADLEASYRRDRTENQDTSIFLGVEKNGITEQLLSWFGDLGVPILALGGYSSQTFVDDVSREAKKRDRPAVLIYAGDFDASGEDIDRDFVARTDCFDKVVRIALNRDQIDQYGLPPLPGKPGDRRAAGFAERHGRLMQVELDALPPEVLRGLYQDAIDEFHDVSRFEAVLEREAADRLRLA